MEQIVFGLNRNIFYHASENDIFFLADRVFARAKEIFDCPTCFVRIKSKHLPPEKTMLKVCEKILFGILKNREDDMSKITENAIKNAFKTLLDKKPLNQITVKDITDECGITRNSFYYHYQDIPTLIETIVKEEIDLLAAEQDTIDSLEDCFATIVKYCIHDKKMLLHIYNSVNRNIFESSLMKQCEYAVRRYVDSVLNIQDVEDEDREIIIRYLKCLAFGTVIDWFENGMNENIIEHFHRLCELKSGQTAEMIERCKRK